jgi:hypothetical protein
MKEMILLGVVGFYRVLDRIKNMNKGFIFLAIISALFWKCAETKEIIPGETGINYFPLQAGTYRIYQVEGTMQNYAEDEIGFSYLLKESVVDSFQNLESGISYKIERQKKYNENDPWETDSIWTARVDKQTAVRVEHNIPVVSLTFPLLENKTWDGNKLNAYDEEEFEMINIDESYSDSFNSYGQTVTVIQEYLPDYIDNYISRKEIYSKDQGLIYKENIILIYKQDEVKGDGAYIGKEIVETSLVYYQHLIEYGEE